MKEKNTELANITPPIFFPQEGDFAKPNTPKTLTKRPSFAEKIGGFVRRSSFSLSGSSEILLEPETCKRALATTSNDTKLLLGLSAVVRSGFGVEIVAIMTAILDRMNCSVGVRVGTSAITNKEIELSFKPMEVKTKTCNQGIFADGTIPQNDRFRRSGDSLPNPLPEHSSFMILPVSLLEILSKAEGNTPIYTDLKIEGDYLTFRAPQVSSGKFANMVFGLNLLRSVEKHFYIQPSLDKNADPFQPKENELLPWRSNKPNIGLWKEYFGSKWDERQHGCLEAAANNLYESALKEFECEAFQPLEVFALDGKILTGDIDICYLAVPTKISIFGKEEKVDNKFIRPYETCGQNGEIEQLNLIETFKELYVIHKNNWENRTSNNFYQILEDELSYVKAFVKTAGNITPYELLFAFLVNRAVQEKFPFFDNIIQHGGDNLHPATPSSLQDSVLHIYIAKKPFEVSAAASDLSGEPSTSAAPGTEGANHHSDYVITFMEKILTYDEGELAVVVEKLLQNQNMVHIHPRWNMEIWEPIVKRQYESPAHRAHMLDGVIQSALEHGRRKNAEKSWLEKLGEQIAPLAPAKRRQSLVEGVIDEHAAFCSESISRKVPIQRRGSMSNSFGIYENNQKNKNSKNQSLFFRRRSDTLTSDEENSSYPLSKSSDLIISPPSCISPLSGSSERAQSPFSFFDKLSSVVGRNSSLSSSLSLGSSSETPLPLSNSGTIPRSISTIFENEKTIELDAATTSKGWNTPK